MADHRTEPRSETEALACAFRGVVFRREAADAARLHLGCNNAEVKKLAKLKPDGSLAVDISACRICKHWRKTGSAAVDPPKKGQNDDMSWLLMIDDEEG